MDGKQASAMRYRAEEWSEKGIRARRFLPCPHCGCAVSGRERIWTSPVSGAQVVFREARCVNTRCGWHYFKHDGSREEFVAEANRRIEQHVNGD